MRMKGIRKIKTAKSWMIAAGVSVFILLTGAGTWLAVRGGRDDSAAYEAYQYLKSGNMENARAAAAELRASSKGDACIVEVLADAGERDYMAVYFKSREMEQEGTIPKGQEEVVAILKEDAMARLGIGGELNPTAYDTALDTWYQSLSMSGWKQNVYEEKFLQDRLLTEEGMEYMTDEAMEALLLQYGGQEDILRRAIRYYSEKGNYDRAMELAELLIRVADTTENQIIYTDLIADKIYHGNVADQTRDKEAGKLLAKAEGLKAKAERYNQDTEADREKQSALYNEADLYLDQMQQLEISRAINYLKAKKPMFGDSSGYYDLQMAKLYMAVGDKEEASRRVQALINNYMNLKDSSRLKEALSKLADVYNLMKEEGEEAKLKKAMEELMAAQSQGVVNGINSRFSDYVASYLKFSNLRIHIGSIDGDDFPEVTVKVNISGSKRGMTGKKQDFTKSDFTLADSGYSIRDFTMKSREKDDKVSIAIVMDGSGSMENGPLRDAKQAAIGCINSMNTEAEQFAIISYSSGASVVKSLSSGQQQLIQGINSIRAGGGTNIPAGLKAGIGALRGAKKGSSAIILLSDGQDGSSGDMDSAILEAQSAGISVYTVGFGNADVGYLSSIASRTGGLHLTASSTSELSEIYLLLQRYINNNYEFHYTITENPEKGDRKATVLVTGSGLGDQADYEVEGIEEPEELAVESLQPDQLKMRDIERGAVIGITGKGFKNGMSIQAGGIELTDIQVVDEYLAYGTLKGSMTPGYYTLTARRENQEASVLNGIEVIRSLDCTTVTIGDNTITASQIGQTGEADFILEGNVCMNGFLRTEGTMKIHADALPPNFDMESSKSQYLGERGTITGDSCLYVTYEKKENDDSFTNLMLGGKSMALTGDSYSVSVNGPEAKFDKTFLDGRELVISKLASVGIKDISYTARGLHIESKSLNSDEIFGNISSVIKKMKSGKAFQTSGSTDTSGSSASSGSSSSSSHVVEKLIDNKAKKHVAIDGSLSVWIMPQEIKVNGEGKLSFSNGTVKLGNIALRTVSFKLDTMSASREYWKFGIGVTNNQFLTMVTQLKLDNWILKENKDDVVTMEVSSFYMLPDKIRIVNETHLTSVGPIDINKLECSAQGLSGLLLHFLNEEQQRAVLSRRTKDEAKTPDFVFAGSLGGDINLFAKPQMLKETIEKIKGKDAGKIGTANAGFELNVPKETLKVSTDFNVLGQTVSGALIFDFPDALELEAKAKAGKDLKLDFLTAKLGGQLDLYILFYQGCTDMKFSGAGTLDINWANIHEKKSVDANVIICKAGEGTSSERTVIQLTVQTGNRVWYIFYDDYGNILKNSIYADTFEL